MQFSFGENRKKVLETNLQEPFVTDASLLLCQVQLQLENPEDALQTCDDALSKSQFPSRLCTLRPIIEASIKAKAELNARRYIRKGVNCLNESNYSNSIAAFRSAIASLPTLAVSHYWLALTLEMEGVAGEREVDYDNNLEKKPRSNKKRKPRPSLRPSSSSTIRSRSLNPSRLNSNERPWSGLKSSVSSKAEEIVMQSVFGIDEGESEILPEQVGLGLMIGLREGLSPSRLTEIRACLLRALELDPNMRSAREKLKDLDEYVSRLVAEKGRIVLEQLQDAEHRLKTNRVEYSSIQIWSTNQLFDPVTINDSTNTGKVSIDAKEHHQKTRLRTSASMTHSQPPINFAPTFNLQSSFDYPALNETSGASVKREDKSTKDRSSISNSFIALFSSQDFSG